MKNFTLKFRTLICAFVAMLFAMPSMAQLKEATDFYGTWKFTADTTLTAAGIDHKDLLKAECDVVIEAGGMWHLKITGVGGGVNGQLLDVDFSDNTMSLTNPNPGNATLWGSGVWMANETGSYPAGGNYNRLTWTFDADKKEISVPDFTAVTCNYDTEEATVLAYFKNAKLVQTSQQTVEVDDMSGDYEFEATSYSKESEFTNKFKLTLNASNVTFTEYTATMTFEGYEPLAFSNVTFDGNLMKFPYNAEMFVDAEKTIYFSGMYEDKREGTIEFSKAGENLVLGGMGMVFNKSDLEVEEGRLPVYQWYLAGTAVKAVNLDAEFPLGTYIVKVANPEEDFTNLSEGTDWYFDYPTEFELVIQPHENPDYAHYIYVTSFMGQDVKALNQGGFYTTIVDNVVSWAASTSTKKYVRKISADYDAMDYCYDILRDGEGNENSNPIKLTANADGTYTLDDFTVFRYHYYLDENWTVQVKQDELVAIYSNLVVTKKGGEVVGVESVEEKASTVKISVKDGAICVEGAEGQSVQVYSMNAQQVFSGKATVVSGLNKGIYVVKCGNTVKKVAL